MKERYHKMGYRGYPVPALAVCGASDTGMWPDSPCPSDEVRKELNRVRREVLRPAGIKSRMRFGNTSNVFCAKRWLYVSRDDFPKAAQLMCNWLHEHDRELRFVHDAELEQAGFKPEVKEGV